MPLSRPERPPLQVDVGRAAEAAPSTVTVNTDGPNDAAWSGGRARSPPLRCASPSPGTSPDISPNILRVRRAPRSPKAPAHRCSFADVELHAPGTSKAPAHRWVTASSTTARCSGLGPGCSCSTACMSSQQASPTPRGARRATLRTKTAAEHSCCSEGSRSTNADPSHCACCSEGSRSTSAGTNHCACCSEGGRGTSTGPGPSNVSAQPKGGARNFAAGVAGPPSAPCIDASPSPSPDTSPNIMRIRHHPPSAKRTGRRVTLVGLEPRRSPDLDDVPGPLERTASVSRSGRLSAGGDVSSEDSASRKRRVASPRASDTASTSSLDSPSCRTRSSCAASVHPVVEHPEAELSAADRSAGRVRLLRPFRRCNSDSASDRPPASPPRRGFLSSRSSRNSGLLSPISRRLRRWESSERFEEDTLRDASVGFFRIRPGTSDAARKNRDRRESDVEQWAAEPMGIVERRPRTAETAKALATERAKAREERYANEVAVRRMWHEMMGDSPGLAAEVAKLHATDQAKLRFREWELACEEESAARSTRPALTFQQPAQPVASSPKTRARMDPGRNSSVGLSRRTSWSNFDLGQKTLAATSDWLIGMGERPDFMKLSLRASDVESSESERQRTRHSGSRWDGFDVSERSQPGRSSRASIPDIPESPVPWSSRRWGRWFPWMR